MKNKKLKNICSLNLSVVAMPPSTKEDEEDHEFWDQFGLHSKICPQNKVPYPKQSLLIFRKEEKEEKREREKWKKTVGSSLT
jgi:hypothetical protein